MCSSDLFNNNAMKMILLDAWILSLIIFSSNLKGQDSYSSVHTIDIGDNVKKMQKIYLSQFADSISYISLEFSQEFPVGVIRSLSFFDNYILVNDFKSCLLYDREGHFIRNIGKNGRGPGEYQFLTCSRLYKDKIYVQSVFDLFEYEIDGTFIGKTKNRFMFNNNTYQYSRNWININDSLIFSHMPNPTGNIPYKALLSGNEGKIFKTYKNYILFFRGKPISITDDNAHIYQFKQMIFFKEYYNDTLYCLDSQFNLLPKYVFKLGKYKEPLSNREKSIAEMGKSEANYIFIPEIFQNDNYLFIKCKYGNHFPAKRLTPETVKLPTGNISTKWYNTKFVLGVYNKHTKQISFCEPTSTDNALFTSGIYNDIDAGPRFFPDIQVNDSTLVMMIKPSDLIKHTESDDFKNILPSNNSNKKKLEDLANKIKDLDNPVLMFVRLKK